MTIRPAAFASLLALLVASGCSSCGVKPPASTPPADAAAKALASIVATLGSASGEVQVRRAGQ